MTPATILHLLPNFEVGGAQEVLCRTIEVLDDDERFRHVAVGVFEGPQDFRGEFDRACAKTYDINTCRAPITRPWAFARDVRHIWGSLVRICRSENVRLVHGQTHDNDLLAVLLGRRLGIPSVATHQGARLYPDNRMGRSLRRSARTGMLRWVMNSVDAVIAVGPDVKDNLVEIARAPEEKVLLLKNSVSRAETATQAERDELRDRLDLQRDRAYFVAVGRLIPAKGVDTLIEAAAALADHPLRPTLLVVGDGPDRERLEGIARELGVHGERAVFLGLRSDVPDVLAASDIYVSASHSEGTSLALLEAMARGLSCAVANAPGLADLVTDGTNGRLFNVRDGADCARVIAEVLAEPELSRERAAHAQETVRRDFSIEALAEAHGSLYGRLLDGD